MQKQLSIGRNTDNDIVISQSDISGRHLLISLDDDGHFLLEDQNSTNGVFVNGYRISRAKVSAKDEVRLSENKIIDLKELFKDYLPPPVGQIGNTVPETPKPKAAPNDYTVEFAQLKDVWHGYHQARTRISENYKRNSLFLRTFLMVLPLLIWTVLKHFYIDGLKDTDSEAYAFWSDKFLYFSVPGAAIGGLITDFIIRQPTKKLAELEAEFRVRYVCPNEQCRQQLGSIPWEAYHNQKKCFRCKAKYSDG